MRSPVDEEFTIDWDDVDVDGGIMRSPVFRKNDLRLFCYVRLSALVPVSNGFAGPNAEESKGWGFPILVCRGTEVILADTVADIDE